MDFLEKDENSRLCPGKKDTITRKKHKWQKRFLNDSLQNLFKDFCAEVPQFKLSYATCCKFRPFWIVFPKVTDRGTCKCVQHENMYLLVDKLHAKKLIEQKSSYELCKTLCCEGDHLKEKCLERRCSLCINKTMVTLPTCEENDTIIYHQWVTKKVPNTVKGNKKVCQKSVKEEYISTNKNIL